ncbi:DNA-binding SARP family transcriptional activator [Murinocardiopsis flavida]|uniref:DNA-binding SARP family transcriptional activator n=1 Tax=Murinocardiopsis flavida TaxID=645275 RepID=A0A2P8DPE3_9ACTN|nr:tetratricopeptide repeat protein [Murinocardiopsis flavida]PSK99092.1 DNA-binding SARP family transcriptional activator [Murinocardiopsis flavida]
MELRVLGSVGVSIAGNRVDLGSGKEIALVAALGIARGRFVSAGQLADQVWDGETPGKTTFQGTVSRVRKKLAEHDGERRIIEQGGAYRLEIRPEDIDWHRFQSAVTDSEALVRNGSEDAALTTLGDALALWQGDPLTGTGGVWADSWREMMRTARASAMARWAEVSTRIRPTEDVSGTIGEFVAIFPFDERLNRCLMQALHAADRTTEALAAYRRYARNLARRFGTDPGPRVVQEYERMREGARAEPGSPAPRPVDAPLQRDNLAHDIADFTDRTQELAHFAAASHCRFGVHVLNGRRGVGKSTLAVHAAHQIRSQFPDARFYLDLRGDQEDAHLEPLEALQELLAMNGVTGSAVPSGLDQRAALWRDQVCDKRMLLVLDHAKSPEQVRPLLPGAPKSMVLVTADRSLNGLHGIQNIRLLPPEVVEAEKLLSAVSGRDRSEGPDEIRTLVELCDRLPFALRLLGTWLRKHPTWTLAMVRDRLMEAGDLIRGLPEVGAKLEAVLTLATKGVTPEARALLLYVGTHPDGRFSLGAAAALVGLETDECEPLLEELLDCHLIEETRPYRYRIDGLVATFAGLTAAREIPGPDVRAAHVRLVEYYLCACRAADRLFEPGGIRMPIRTLNDFRPLRFADTAAVAAWFIAERPTLLSVANWAFDHRHLAVYGARLTHAMAAMIGTYGPLEAALRLHAESVRVWRDRIDHAALAHALIDQARGYNRVSQGDAALACVREAARLWEGMSDSQGEAIATEQIGLAFGMSERLREARPYLQRAVLLHRNGLSPPALANCLHNLAICDQKLGDLNGAAEKFTEAQELYQAYGDLGGTASVYTSRAGAFHESGRYREAIVLLEKALALSREIQDRSLEATIQGNFGEICDSRHAFRQALRYYARALRLWREDGNRREELWSLIGVGKSYRALGVPRKAVDYFEAARRLVARFAGSESEAIVLTYLGEAYADLGEDDRSVALIGDAHEIAVVEELPIPEIKALLALGRYHWGRGRGDTAYPLLKEAETLGATVQAPTEMADVKWLLDAIELSRVADEPLTGTESSTGSSRPPGRSRVPRPRPGADTPSTRRPQIGTSDQAG